MTLALRIAYDGTAYQGWNVQPGRPTVQGLLAARLGRLVPGRTPRIQGAARTDTGVHAIEQVAAWSDPPASLAPERLVRACRKLLPPDVRVWDAASVGDSFDPRRGCRFRVYRYHFSLEPPLSPFLAPYVVPLSPRLDPERMAAAALGIEGRVIDMRSFAAELEPGGSAAPREVFRCRVRPVARFWCLEVAASGFLHHAVRRMIGTLVEVGRGRMPPEGFAEVALAGDGRRAGQTMPPQGLFLWQVAYDDPPPFAGGPAPWTPLGPYNP